MGKIENSIKSEITRLAKKEINAILRPLASEVLAMKKKLSDFNKRFTPLQRWAKDKIRQDEKDKLKLEASAGEVKSSRFTPQRIRNLRQKLGLSQKELAILTGVSLGTVAMWEKGKFAPRKDKKAALIALKKLGKREVRKVLEKKRQEAGEGKPKRRNAKKAAKRKAGKGMKAGARGKWAGKAKIRKR